MKKLIMLIALLAAFAFPVTTFALVSIEGSVGAWGTMPSGDFSYKDGGVPTTDLDDTFGFDDEISPMVRLKVEVPVIPVMYFMYTPIKFEGDAETGFTFDGQDFDIGADTELTLDQYDLALYYGVPFLGLASLGKVHINVGLNIRVIDVDATMTQPGGTVEKNESVTIPVPMLYLAADVSPIDLLVFEAEVRAFPVNDYSAVSAIARVKVNTFGPLYVSGGYRYEAMNIDHDDFDFDIDLTGPFAEVGFDF